MSIITRYIQEKHFKSNALIQKAQVDGLFVRVSSPLRERVRVRVNGAQDHPLT
jgi:hypothetical protein